MNRELPKPGEIWRHFKGNYYIIFAIGHHSETREKLVVYRVLTPEEREVLRTTGGVFESVPVGEPCIRPLSMFMGLTPRARYPDADQQYRFEKVGYERI